MSELEKSLKDQDESMKGCLSIMTTLLLLVFGAGFMIIDLFILNTGTFFIAGVIVAIIGGIKGWVQSNKADKDLKEIVEQTKEDEESVDDSLDKF